MAGATSPLEWPQLDTRESRNVLSEVIARVFVQCVSDYRVSVEHLRGIFVSIANAVFGQNWELESFREGEAASSAPRVVKDLTRVFPSGRSMNRWIKAAAILNLQYLGSRIKNQEKDETVTCCHDDTTKAAGHKRFDVKCIEFVFKKSNGKLGNSLSWAHGKCLTLRRGLSSSNPQSLSDDGDINRRGFCTGTNRHHHFFYVRPRGRS